MNPTRILFLLLILVFTPSMLADKTDVAETNVELVGHVSCEFFKRSDSESTLSTSLKYFPA